jgi:IS1 family transposase
MSILPHFSFCPCQFDTIFWASLLFVILFGFLLEAYWRIYRGRIKKYFKSRKPKKPRKLRPKSPQDCVACCEGKPLLFFRPRTDVVPYQETKSPRGRKKTIRTAGHACPNRQCTYFAVTAEELHALVGDGKCGQQGQIQYFKCQACDKRFTCRLHTPMYNLKTDPEWVMMVLLYLAEGCDISVLVRCTRHAEETVTRWLERMGTHSQKLHNQLFQKLNLPLLQLDELYARVRRVKVRWLWLALDPITKIIPALQLGSRKTEEGMQLVHELWQRLHPDCLPAFTTDGLSAYFYALTAHFGHWFLPLRARKPHWQVAEKLLHGQLVKKKRGRKLLAQMRMGWGEEEALFARLTQYGFRALIQTAFIERLNLTIRRGVAPLMRKTWAYAQTPTHLLLHVEWWRAYYHFVRPHESLAMRIPGLKRTRKKSPGMAAGLSHRLWTVGEILARPLHPVLE